MTTSRLHFVWHIHQPFFISESEIRARIGSTYVPFLTSLIDRKIPFSLNITGATLDRLNSIDPTFVEWLISLIRENNVTFVGSSAHHAFLAWLPLSSLRAQLLVDAEIKASFPIDRAPILLPTDLSWSHRVGIVSQSLGYEYIFVNSEVRKLTNTVPRWNTINERLVPAPSHAAPAGESSTLELSLGAEKSVRLLVHEESIASQLRQDMLSDEMSARKVLQNLESSVRSKAIYRMRDNDVFFVSEDVERFIPSKLSKFLEFLDQLNGSALVCESMNDALQNASTKPVSYVPACSAQGDDAMWTHTVDDRWFREHLERVATRLGEAINISTPRSSEEVRIWNRLLSIQDSSYYYWHFTPRSRSSFHARLIELEEWLDARSNETDRE